MSQDRNKEGKAWGVSSRRVFSAALGTALVSGCGPLTPGGDAGLGDAGPDGAPDVVSPPLEKYLPPEPLPAVMASRPGAAGGAYRDGHSTVESQPLKGVRVWSGSLERRLEVVSTPAGTVVSLFHPHYGTETVSGDAFGSGALHHRIRTHLGESALHQALDFLA